MSEAIVIEYLKQLVERQKKDLSFLYGKVRDLEERLRDLEEEVRRLNQAAGVYEDLGL
jgi:polyhydroxyalkanoate synthesis regulator phasin